MNDHVKALACALYNGRKPKPGDTVSHAVEVIKAVGAHLEAVGLCEYVWEDDAVVCGDPDCTYCGLVAAFESVVDKR